MFRNTPEFKEIHPDKNDLITLNQLKQSSNKKIWWKCNKSVCGGHVWKTSINNRTASGKTGCPICSNRKICLCDNKCNSLGTLYPDLVKEWHPTKNDKTPFEYPPTGGKFVWWKCNKSVCGGHVWKAVIYSRTGNAHGCPICSTRAVCQCKDKCSSLGYLHPKISEEWHPTKNDKTPFDFNPSSNKTVWWKCNKSVCDGHVWKTSIGHRVGVNRTNCPICSTRAVCQCKDKCSSLGYLHPKISEEWHPTKNDKTPFDFNPSSNKTVWWKCQEETCKNYEWKTAICNRINGHTGCPVCRSSHGEKYILDVLLDLELMYIREQTFSDCKYKALLRFDFYLPDFNLCIEFDGIQHFEPVSFFGGKIGYELIRIKDKIKDQYCLKHGLRLIRIPYYNFNRIDQIIEETIFMQGLMNILWE